MYGVDKTLEVKEWSVWTEDDTVVVEWGKLDGKKQTKKTVCKAKNVGRSNETTPEQQAISEDRDWETDHSFTSRVLSTPYNVFLLTFYSPNSLHHKTINSFSVDFSSLNQDLKKSSSNLPIQTSLTACVSLGSYFIILCLDTIENALSITFLWFLLRSTNLNPLSLTLYKDIIFLRQ